MKNIYLLNLHYENGMEVEEGWKVFGNAMKWNKEKNFNLWYASLKRFLLVLFIKKKNILESENYGNFNGVALNLLSMDRFYVIIYFSNYVISLIKQVQKF